MSSITYCMDCRHFQPDRPDKVADVVFSPRPWPYCKLGRPQPHDIAGCRDISPWTKEERQQFWEERLKRDPALARLIEAVKEMEP